MPKPELEFHCPQGPWVSAPDALPGMWTQVLAEDVERGAYTGLLRYDPGVDTSPLGVRVHDYWEEVYILEGDLTDLHLGPPLPPVCMPAARREWLMGRGGPCTG